MMSTRPLLAAAVATMALAAGLAVPGVPGFVAGHSGAADNAQGPSRLQRDGARLPVRFEANQGQLDPKVAFVARGGGSSLFLSPGEAVLDVKGQGDQGAALRLRLEGAAPVAPQGVGRLGGVTNILRGTDPAGWHRDVPTYAKVAYREVRRGVDWVFYGVGGHLEYDLVVRPGADPTALTMAVDGADRLAVAPGGELVVHSAAGELRNGRPHLYQDIDGRRRTVAGRYDLRGPNRIGFTVGPYDPTRPLVIDPILSYSFTLGGAGTDVINDLFVDASGNAFVTGQTDSADLPTTTGAYDRTLAANGSDAFVAKLNPAGTALVWSTYLGGSVNSSSEPPDDRGLGVAADGAGNVYVTGGTKSQDFPVTPSAFQSTLTCAVAPTNMCAEEVFLTKLNPGGSAILYSSYLGDVGGDYGFDIALGPGDTAYVGGVVGNQSRVFDTTVGAFQAGRPCLQTFGQCFYPVGFVSIFDTMQSGTTSLVASTLLQDISSSQGFVSIRGIAADSSGNAYVTGATNLGDFPMTPGSYDTSCGTAPECNRVGGANWNDAFVTKFNSELSAPTYSTYVGGSHDDEGRDIVLDAAGNAYITGFTTSVDYPTLNAYDGTCGTGGDCDPFNECDPGTCTSIVPAEDVFVTKLNPAGTALGYSTYLGGAGRDFGEALAVVGPAGLALVTGSTRSSVPGSTTSVDFPLTASPLATVGGGFVSRLGATGATLGLSTYLGAAYGTGMGVAQLGASIYVGGVRGTNGFVAKIATPVLKPPADFNGDARTDRSVYRGGAWYAEGQATAFLGVATDIPVPADYDGNGTTDRAVYRDGAWYTEGQPTVFLGVAGDVPVPGDYNGDGRAERAVFRPSAGAWYTEGQATVYHGATGDIAVPGDYNGDGTTDRAIFRPAVGGWYVAGQATAFLGLNGDIPVPGDYDGNGTTERGIWRPAVGGWYIEGLATTFVGLSGDVPVPGDYDGNATTDRGIWRPAVGGWYVDGQATAFLGLNGDIPLPLPQAVYRRFF